MANLPDVHLRHDPYEWFEPESGRPVRTAILLEIVQCRQAGLFSHIKRAQDYLESLAGVRRVRLIPLDKLGVVAKAMTMLRSERLRRKAAR